MDLCYDNLSVRGVPTCPSRQEHRRRYSSLGSSALRAPLFLSYRLRPVPSVMLKPGESYCATTISFHHEVVSPLGAFV